MPEVKVEPSVFLSKLHSLGKLYQAYGVYNVATKIVFNYLPADAKEVREILEDARKYSETFYKDNSAMFSRAADYLKVKTGYPKHLILIMTREELHEYQETGQLPSKETLQQRYDCSGMYFDQNGLHILPANEVKDIEKYWLDSAKKSGLRGTVAYPSKAKGVCRVVFDYQKANLKEGEILVTGMTDPDFVPLMKRVAGIVTDEGGIACHAAIVSRELGIPCIIGTKIATQVLKDGDEVEVDADKGIVKILKKV